MVKRKLRAKPKPPPPPQSSYSLSESERTAESYSTATSVSASKSSSTDSIDKRRSYQKIKHGLKRAIPAAIILWAFHKIPSSDGLTSRRVINFIKKHYRVANDPRKTGKSLGAFLRCAVDFGLLEKRGNRFFLVKKNQN